MAPDALRRAMAYAADHAIDHLAAVPDLWPSSLLVDAVMAPFSAHRTCKLTPEKREVSLLAGGK